MDATPLSSTPRTRLRRQRDRARLDRTELYEVLDAGMICHLGVVVDGAPVVIPTGYGRIGDTLFVHGSTANRALLGAAGAEICVTVTHLDGIVLARSIFHHSVNYRSAVIYGTSRPVGDPQEKVAALRAISERLAPGQWDVVRTPSKKELAATIVLAVPLDEASVKVRQGPPGDEEEDYALDVWAGVQPVRQVFGDPVPDPLLRPGIAVPAHIAGRSVPRPRGRARHVVSWDICIFMTSVTKMSSVRVDGSSLGRAGFGSGVPDRVWRTSAGDVDGPRRDHRDRRARSCSRLDQGDRRAGPGPPGHGRVFPGERRGGAHDS
jgi:nitroimidazol reductase NimA-like FMN-containing flavoprotein (pyridoxamine 5'-phosphate oxidase superfamily)